LNIVAKNVRLLSLTETVIFSLLLHVTLLFFMPDNNFVNIQDLPELKINILPEEKKLPIPEPIIEPLPEIIPEPEPIIEPIIKPIPKPPVTKPLVSSSTTTIDKKNTSQKFIIENKIDEYRAQLRKVIKKQIRYPRIARVKNIQGVVIIELRFDGQGTLLNYKIKESSGFSILDKEGLKIIKRVQETFPQPPEILRTKIFNVTIPISFKLQ